MWILGSGYMIERLISPLDGTAVQLEDVSDEVFSQKVVGDGLGIVPKVGVLSAIQTIYAPIAGKVIMVFESKHAVGIRSNEGVEILIHIGIDTVSLNGDGFVTHIEVGDDVAVGDKLVSVNFKKVIKNGFDPVTLILCTNRAINIKDFQGDVKRGMPLFDIA